MTHVEANTPAPGRIGHFIGGQVSTGADGATQDVLNPATGDVLGTLCLAGDDDVARVVEVASDAAVGWGRESLARRTRVLFAFRNALAARADDLAALITAEHGKTLGDARGEIARGLEVAEFACGLTDHLKGQFSSGVSSGIDVFSAREPLGVVAGITPFNFPIMVPLWMVPVAIAAGNAFILKPSPHDPSASLELGHIWREAGLPDGVFNVLQGDKQAVDGLIDHPDVAAISFVGSTPVARDIYRRGTARGKRVQALGGAKNHAVVLPDADMANVSEHLSAAAFGSAGQRCMAVSVAIATDAVADRLVASVADRAGAITVGEGTNEATEMGPLISAGARERVTGIVGKAQADGADLPLDGRDCRVPGHGGGFFMGPTVLDRVQEPMEAYREEIFGPVLSVMRVPDLEAAIEVINNNPYGNGTGIFTGSGAHARKFQREVKVGMVGINVPIPVPISAYSFGGWNASLFGDLHVYGEDGIRFYTRQKVVTQRWPEPASLPRASFDFPSH